MSIAPGSVSHPESKEGEEDQAQDELQKKEQQQEAQSTQKERSQSNHGLPKGEGFHTYRCSLGDSRLIDQVADPDQPGDQDQTSQDNHPTSISHHNPP
jgi:hypothetical protein